MSSDTLHCWARNVSLCSIYSIRQKSSHTLLLIFFSVIDVVLIKNKGEGHRARLREKEHLFSYRAYFEGNLLRFVRARAPVHALMTRVSCAVGIRNAKLKNHLKPRPNDHNMPTQHIAILLGATRCVRLATVLRLLFGVKRTITSYCFTLLSKMQMTPLFCVWLIHYDVSCAVWHGSLTSVAICCVGSFFRFTFFNIAHCLVCCNRLAGAFLFEENPIELWNLFKTACIELVSK